MHGTLGCTSVIVLLVRFVRSTQLLDLKGLQLRDGIASVHSLL